MKKSTPWIAWLFLVSSCCSTGPEIEFVESPDRIDVLIAGELFTSYRHGDQLSKPVLHPLRSASGIEVNRGYPLSKKEGESEDHPHHAGLFFTYDKVNSHGFWNNASPPPQIRHEKLEMFPDGQGGDALSVVLNWVPENEGALLEERRRMAFSTAPGEYAIDFHIDLVALREKVVFEDTKEGMLGIRVASWLKEKGGTGRYLSSGGDETEKNVWGKRAAWVRLEGKIDGHTVGIAVFNHPSSVNYPTFWHARGYGLFAANPLGQHAFESSRKVNDPQHFRLELDPGEKAGFRFLVVVYEGEKTKKELDRRFEEYKRR